MEPIQASQATVTDLLDRILDKGLVISADLIISVSGIPLIGVNLKASLAGMETMLKYGMMKDWDEATREYAKIEKEKRQKQKVPLAEGEEVFVKMFGSHWYSKGIFRSWRPGHFYVTDRRIFLFRKEPPEMLFEAPYEIIKGMVLERKKNVAKKETEYLYLLLKSGETVQLHPADARAIKKAVDAKIKDKGLKLEDITSIPVIDERARKFLLPDETVTHSEKIWHLLPAAGIMSETWKPGYLYLTNKRLCWWYDFDGRIAFETPRDSMLNINIALDNNGNMGLMNKEKVMNILYRVNSSNKVARFSAKEEKLRDWEKVLLEIIELQSEVPPEFTETCPQCGARQDRKKLLTQGCPVCGWVSPRLKRETKVGG